MRWFFIKTRDKQIRGYGSGKDKIDACKRFGYNIEQCIIEEVECTPNGFVHINSAEQLSLKL